MAPTTSSYGRGLRIVFLDFDGVLAVGGSGLDAALVARLNRLVATAGAAVVVSSSWRRGTDVLDLATALRSAGFVGTVVGATPTVPNLDRGYEIQAWLNDTADAGCEVESFVILDDDDDMAHLRPRLVQTNPDAGLSDGDVERAVRMLNVPYWRE